MSFSLEVANTLSDSDIEAIQGLMMQLGEGHAVNDKTQIQKVAADSTTSLVIARDDDNRLVAMTIVNVFPKFGNNEARLDDVVVDESMRGQGVGKSIMQKAIDIAWEMGANKIELTSRPSRVAANVLYQKLGFKLRKTNVYQLKKGA